MKNLRKFFSKIYNIIGPLGVFNLIMQIIMIFILLYILKISLFIKNLIIVTWDFFNKKYFFVIILSWIKK